MSFAEPLPSQAPRGTDRRTGNAYTGRWRWWYSSIADHMLQNPKVSQKEIAAALGRSVTTVGYIMATDMFREYYAQRRAAFTSAHDQSIRQKLLGVTEAALDTLQSQINTKKGQIPIGMVKDITEMALEKLGYGLPAAPSVVVNNNPQTIQVQAAALPELEAARNALRAAEARHVGTATPLPMLTETGEADDLTEVIEALMEDRQGVPSK